MLHMKWLLSALLFLLAQLCLTALLVAQTPYNSTAPYDKWLTALSFDGQHDLSKRVYDYLLESQNASMKQQVLLRQRLQYADKATMRLFTQRDSILVQVGRFYEQPRQLNTSVLSLLHAADSLEQQVLQRLRYEKSYFRALSIQFAQAAYEVNPTPKSLACLGKIKLQKGSDELAEKLAQYAAAKDTGHISWQQLASSLRPTEAIVTFVHYQNTNDLSMRYGAFVLRAGRDGPLYIDLCGQQILQRILEQGNIDDAFYFDQLYSPDTTLSEGPTLYELLWKPLSPFFSHTKRIYYIPAGDLHRLNLAALSPQKGSPRLQAKYSFVLLNNMRSLLGSRDFSTEQLASLPSVELPCDKKTSLSKEWIGRFLGSAGVEDYDPLANAENKEAVLLGNIRYDMDTLAIRAQRYTPVAPASTRQARKRQLGKGGQWEILYSTEKELIDIEQLLVKADYKVKIYQGYAASEEAFKQLGKEKPSPRILHIATHGFFLPNRQETNYRDALHETGIILAGANYAWSAGQPLKGFEDGILTAFEISTLALQNTELVVLSACETGLGYIVNNDGVYGLQRAFKQAGVRNILMSLWSVPDQATQLLMTQFYQNCLEKDMSLREALRAAQQALSNQTGYESPYYWSGFVLLE